MMRKERCVYVACCAVVAAASYAAIAWGFLRMAISSPIHAAVSLGGIAALALVRLDMKTGYGRRTK